MRGIDEPRHPPHARSSRSGGSDKVELLGRRLRKLRKDRGWSLADLAERTGLDHQEVLGVERGEARLGLETIVRLLGTLGLEPADLERLAAAEREVPPDSERFRRDLSG
jgi:transcriptional regulator with XRE-family HTH domain